MLKLSLHSLDGPRRILCIGAHSDDIEIGCGGTILRLLNEGTDIEVWWTVLAAKGVRIAEAEHSASRFLANANTKRIIVKDFADGFFPYQGADIKGFFEELKRDYSPDLIFTHYRHDLHQDHRLVSELTWNTFRNNLIFEYEVFKYDGDIGNPNFYVHLSEKHCRQKIAYLLECFESQRNKAWFTEDAFYALLRLRGIEANAPNRYAEALYCRKAVY